MTPWVGLGWVKSSIPAAQAGVEGVAEGIAEEVEAEGEEEDGEAGEDGGPGGEQQEIAAFGQHQPQRGNRRLGAEADVIVTITSSDRFTLADAMVRPGTHLACMGTDTKGKQEVEAALVARARVFTDEIAQAVSIGECQHAVAAGLIADSDITEIGAVINGTAPGRTGPDDLTLFDGTGVGLQDLAVAAAVVDLAVAQGIAIEVDF
jgi:ornithine cyclodeaminase/alanine dehydrogenase-like protein (mu-crystallin family)